jgi:hypothetical protein
MIAVAHARYMLLLLEMRLIHGSPTDRMARDSY